MSTLMAVLVASALLAMLQWVPYIADRALLWGPASFLGNYPEGFPAKEPEPALWAQRSKRAHLNMLEVLPSFTAVALAAEVTGVSSAGLDLAAQGFLVARVVYALVYTLGISYVRTPVYLVSWASVLYMGVAVITG